METEIDKKAFKAAEHHLDNIETLSKRKPSVKELVTMYSYLDNCWICGKQFTFLDRMTFNIQHSFCGNSHRRSCDPTKRK